MFEQRKFTLMFSIGSVEGARDLLINSKLSLHTTSFERQAYGNSLIVSDNDALGRATVFFRRKAAKASRSRSRYSPAAPWRVPLRRTVAG